MQTPVVGLYAVASPDLSGPYGRQEFIVNRYPEAVKKFLGKDAQSVPWNTRVHHAQAMSLIQVDDVLLQLTRALVLSAGASSRADKSAQRQSGGAPPHSI